MSTTGLNRGFEETVIAVILGLMTIVTFVNVVLRYVFNESLIWGLEVTLILFAWLVVFGVSYAVRVTIHLGVDAVTGILPTTGRKILAIISATICLAYAFLLLKGAWDYWAPYAGLYPTDGRWFPTGFESVRSRAYYVTDQVPMPGFLRFLEQWTLNKGYPPEEWEHWEKLPRVIPYAILPVGAALLLFRYIQATLRILRGHADSLIVSHEMEDDVEAARVED